jgi:hypothetical protein
LVISGWELIRRKFYTDFLAEFFTVGSKNSLSELAQKLVSDVIKLGCDV